MDSQFGISVLTPEKEFGNFSSTMALLPAFDGEIGIMPNHIPIILLLGAGIVRIYQGEKLIKDFFVSGGFAEFSENSLTLLVDNVSDISKLKKEEAEKNLNELNADLESSSDINLNKKIMAEISVNRKIIEILSK